MAAYKQYAAALLAVTMLLPLHAGAVEFTTPPELASVLSGNTEAARDQAAVHGIPDARLRAITSEVLKYGVQSGMARRSYEIISMLNEQRGRLDEIYNFGPMMLERNVVPPVLSEAQNSINQPDADTVRIADASYRIERQARFATVPPTWRDYLTIKDLKYEVTPPDSVLNPQNGEEKRLWEKLIRQGWQVGVQQADQIFRQSLALLERDYKGMVLYRSLLAKGMIGLPYVAEANLGITGDGNAMSVNDRVLRITAKPQLEVNSAAWKPIMVPR